MVEQLAIKGQVQQPKAPWLNHRGSCFLLHFPTAVSVYGHQPAHIVRSYSSLTNVRCRLLRFTTPIFVCALRRVSKTLVRSLHSLLADHGLVPQTAKSCKLQAKGSEDG